MNATLREAIAQLYFWAGVSCAPLAIFLGVTSFRMKSAKASSLLLAITGGIFTHLLWYWNAFSSVLGTIAETEVHPPSWIHFLPYGAGAAAFLILLNLARLKAPPGGSWPVGN